MRKRIFKTTILVSVLMLILSLVMVTVFTYGYFEKQSKRMLTHEAVFVARAVEQMGSEYFAELDPENRVTLIGADGRVLYDSDTDPSELDNHGDRPEVQQALKYGEGSAERYSNTFASKTLYYALRLADGQVLRVSCSQSTVWKLLLDMMEMLLCIVLIAILTGVVLSYKTANRIVKPINEIDLEYPERSEAYDELTPLLQRMQKQNRNIAAQMKQLQANRDELEAITEHMSEGFLLLNKEAQVVMLNQSMAELFGKQRGQVLGNALAALDDCTELNAAAARALQGQNTEAVLERRDRSYEIMANPVYSEGRLQGATVFLLDITERAQAETLRRQFSANVSHELRTPLTSIAGYAEIMQNGMVKQADIPTFAGRIKQEASRMVQLVEDIMKLSRLDEHAAETLEWSQVDLYGLAYSVTERLQHKAVRRTVSMTLEGETALVYGVQPVLEEMLHNLCDNAINYNHEGGSVVIQVQQLPQGAMLCIRDTGIGIEKGEQEKVFERFYRVDKSHSRSTGGTGLGLSIVKHGAQLHGARIQLESTPGSGTTVRLYFSK